MKTPTKTFCIAVLTSLFVAAISILSASAADTVTKKEYEKIKQNYEDAKKAVIDGAPKGTEEADTVRFWENQYDEHLWTESEAKAKMDKINKDPKSTKEAKRVAKRNYDEAVENTKTMTPPAKYTDFIYRNLLMNRRLQKIIFNRTEDPNPGDIPPLGASTDVSQISILPVGTYSIAKNPWALPFEAKNHIHVGANYGYSGNLNYDPFQAHSSSFYQINAGLRGNWSNGNSSLAYELGGVGTRYDKGITRDGHDQSMYDFVGSTRFRQEIGPSTIFYNSAYVHRGAHLSIDDNVVFPGVQSKDVLNWRSTSQLAWRGDGQAEFSPGWQQRTKLYWGGFNEVGDDWSDSYRIAIGHTAEFITTPDNGWFVEGEYSMRDFREMHDYNSDSFRIGGGRFGTFPCGAHYRIGAGVQHLEYENSNFDDRDEFYFNGSIFGTLAKADFKLYLNHGVQQPFANWSGGNFVDPLGTSAGLSLSFKPTDKLRVATNFAARHLEADSTQNAAGTLGHYSAGFGIVYKYRENIEFTLDAGVHRVSYDNNGAGSSDIFNTVVIGSHFKF